MIRAQTVGGLLCAAALLFMLQPSVAAPLPGDPCSTSLGPDVIVGDIWDVVQNYAPSGALDALSVGTYACNVGSPDANLPPPYLNTGELRWWAFVNAHPVIAQALHRLRQVDGAWRFEQVGQGWLKHGFFADQNPLCCPTCTQSTQGTKGEWLGIGCADPYTANRNGLQGLMGPKSEVNPFTGEFPYPPSNPPFTGNGRRLQVALGDLAPTSATNLYFAEAQYVHPDDSAAGNQNNNCSYRPVTVSGGPGDYTFALSGASATAREQPALRAWKDTIASVNEVDVPVPDEGLFILAWQVTNLGNGWWHYEYAVQNMNSYRSGASFSAPLGPCVQVQNIGFHDVAYRDGDGHDTSDKNPVNYDGTDWTVSRSDSEIVWFTQTFEQNPNANAQRWGTLYNFRFDASTPPTSATLTLGLYRAGTTDSLAVTAQGPSADTPRTCIADVAGNDGVVDVDDLITVILNWGPGHITGDCAPPPCGDGNVDVDDLIAVILAWGSCP